MGAKTRSRRLHGGRTGVSLSGVGRRTSVYCAGRRVRYRTAFPRRAALAAVHGRTRPAARAGRGRAAGGLMAQAMAAPGEAGRGPRT